MNAAPQPPPTLPATAENTIGLRVLATLVDLLVFIPVFLVMAWLFGDFGRTDDSSFEANLNGFGFVLYIIVIHAYYLVMEGLRGQTIGKMATGLYVMTEDGRQPSWGAIALRTILRLVDWLPVFYLVGFICAAVTPRHQRLGDLVAKTVVGKKPG